MLYKESGPSRGRYGYHTDQCGGHTQRLLNTNKLQTESKFWLCVHLYLKLALWRLARWMWPCFWSKDLGTELSEEEWWKQRLGVSVPNGEPGCAPLWIEALNIIYPEMVPLCVKYKKRMYSRCIWSCPSTFTSWKKFSNNYIFNLIQLYSYRIC